MIDILPSSDAHTQPRWKRERRSRRKTGRPTAADASDPMAGEERQENSSASKINAHGVDVSSFDEPAANSRRLPSLGIQGAAMPGSGSVGPGRWHITITERHINGDQHKRSADPWLTLRVKTPTGCTSLVRSRSQIAALDDALRASLKDHLIPAPDESHCHYHISSSCGNSKRRSILANITKSLQPSKQNAPHFSNTTTLSENSVAPDVLDRLGSHLSALSKHSAVLADHAWRNFFVATGLHDRTLDAQHSDPPFNPQNVEKPATAHAFDAGENICTAVTEHRDGQHVTHLDADTAGAFDPNHSPSHHPHQSNSPGPVSLSESVSPTLNGRYGVACSDAEDHFRGHCENDNRPATAEDSVWRTSATPKGVCIGDFDLLRVLGKGCAGKVLLVRHKGDNRTYALKTLVKKHVLAHRELQHTMTEQAILAELGGIRQADGLHGHPFIARLQWSFQDEVHLYLCLDFYSGGDLAVQLARWGVLGRDRARFYSCEIIVGLEALHQAGIIYRDLKPENVLIGADGHICLTDFGLSKRLGETSTGYTSTFCGTAEYLAPEILLGERYSYAVDWWSFGTMLYVTISRFYPLSLPPLSLGSYEMLFGRTPFQAEAGDHREMYRRVVDPMEELRFPSAQFGSHLSTDDSTKNFIRGLLNRDPCLRISDRRVRKQPYFSMIRWDYVTTRRYRPPFVPDTLADDTDTSNFDKTYLDLEPTLARSFYDDQSTSETPGSPEPSVTDEGADVFGGYSFRSPDAASLKHNEYLVQSKSTTVVSVEEARSLEEPHHRANVSHVTDDSEERGGHTSSSCQGSPISTRATSMHEEIGTPQRHRSTIGLDTLCENHKANAFDSVDDEWDVIGSAKDIGVAKNGWRIGPKSLFARGVVDKYRMQIAAAMRSRASDLPACESTASLQRVASQEQQCETSRRSSRSSANRAYVRDAFTRSANGFLPKSIRRSALFERTSSSDNLTPGHGNTMCTHQLLNDSNAASRAPSRAMMPTRRGNDTSGSLPSESLDSNNQETACHTCASRTSPLLHLAEVVEDVDTCRARQSGPHPDHVDTKPMRSKRRRSKRLPLLMFRNDM